MTRGAHRHNPSPHKRSQALQVYIHLLALVEHGGRAGMAWHLPACGAAVAWGEGAFIQLWCGYTDPHFQMVTKCWAHYAQMSCGGNTFPFLRCWAVCQIRGFEEPSKHPLQTVLRLAWRTLRSTGRKVCQVSLAVQQSFELSYNLLLPRRL